MKKRQPAHGFVLIATLLMLTVLSALVAAYYSLGSVETATTKFTQNSAAGFFAGEAGLNLRAEAIRATFLGYNRPTGTSPTSTNACTSGNMGTGSFACLTHTLTRHTATTYVVEDPVNPYQITIPPGELYQNLNAQEYRFTGTAIARNTLSKVEAQLELRFKSRLVPLFQFAAFYNKDLEILPGPAMTLAGPVHTNGDLYLNSDTSLAISGQVTTAGSVYRGRKNTNVCNSTPVTVPNPSSPLAMLPSCSNRTLMPSSALAPWNGMVQSGVQALTVPAPESTDPTPGRIYWDKADLRLVLRLNGSNVPVTTNSATGIEVRNLDNSRFSAAQTALDACTGSLGGRPIQVATIYNVREAKLIQLLDVDMLALFNCLRSTNWFGTGKQLNDTTEGGLVFHLSVEGPNSAAAANGYGIRARNGSRLQSNIAGAPTVVGLTMVSDQAGYVLGDYNSVNKIPAAFLTDSFNVLSNHWTDASCNTAACPWGAGRAATSTILNSAVLAGTDTTGGTEGSGGQGGAYNGGLENFPRFLEDWSNDTFTYRGSWVSLGRPRHVNGAWVGTGSPRYNPPARNWNYDVSFNNAANLPPITPRFVYLTQELFVRDYEQ